jgi:AcrR family transcriptional regulator
MSSVTPPARRPLRRDAERNRQLILDAAAQVFAERGLDVGFEEIARVAGVGAATVYRRFPDRADLVDALFEQAVDEIVVKVELALAAADPWTGLCDVVHWAVESQAQNRGLAQVLSEVGRGHEGTARARARLAPLVDEMVDRAKHAGSLRDDVTPPDLQALMLCVSRVGTPDDKATRLRLTGFLLDGLTALRAGRARG